MSAIELSRISKRFGPVEVIPDLDLRVESGDFCVLLGPSGCGKSTLLRIVAGLEQASGGEVRIGGKRVDGLPPGERGIAMVFQSYALYPHMTVRDNLAFGLQNIRLARAEIDARVTEAARILEIGHLLDRRPGQLSGGQRQRVAIGRAITKEPAAFLFDEPLSNLDAALRARTRIEIARLHQRLGATMVFVTHDQVEAMTLATRIVVLDHGRIEQVGTPLDIYRRPATRFVAGFIGSPAMNFFEVGVVGGGTYPRIRLPGGTEIETHVPLPANVAGGKIVLGVRPDALKLGSDGPVEGRVEVVEHLGDRTHVHAALAGEGVMVVEAAGDDPVAVGDTVRIALDPHRIHLFDATGRAWHAE